MRFKGLVFFGCLSLATVSNAQSPDVFIRLDVTIQYQFHPSENKGLKGYDPMGRFSTVALDFTLEPGFNFVVSQKFQRIPNDGDPGSFDEYYIEDKGYWRVGKQYLPFGRSIVLRESVYAGTIHLTVGGRAFPFVLGYADAGEGRQQGFMGRIGDKFGFSIMEGHNLAINATALTVIRRPEESPGRGRGYERAIGVDGRMTITPNTSLALDHVSFRRGETIKDELLDVTDVSLTWMPKPDQFATFALTHEWKSASTFLRLTGQFAVQNGIYLEPFIRFKDGRIFDAALSLRIKP